jgi:hypothetical protein
MMGPEPKPVNPLITKALKTIKLAIRMKCGVMISFTLDNLIDNYSTGLKGIADSDSRKAGKFEKAFDAVLRSRPTSVYMSFFPCLFSK